jgi:hypothetical protein
MKEQTMRKSFVLFAALALLALGGLGTGYTNPFMSVEMTGAKEAPGPGDPDGTGTASISLAPSSGEICVYLTVSDIAPATAAHIHRAPAGSPGPVLIPLTPPTSGSSSTCVPIEKELLREIRQHPERFYVNVHNADYPGGAIRAQLSD